MNYQAAYDRLIETRKAQETPCDYHEDHHIIPRCLGGADGPENMVSLTAREHFIAHRLLAKIHPDNTGLMFAVTAFRMLRKDRKLNSRQFGIARKASSDAARRLAAERRLAAAEAYSPPNPQLWAKYSATVLEIAAEGKFYYQTRGHRAKPSARNKARNKIKYTCPHCGKIGKGPNMKRYHLDNCKHRPPNTEAT